MIEQPLISIIIPVYNVEAYIRECLDSILSQSFTNYELILIDDESVDKSLHICRDYKNRYDNIKLICKKNGGAASARNEGIKVASGKYILFIDGDDFIEKDSIEKIVKKISKYGESDIIFLKSFHVLPDGNIVLVDTYNKKNYYNRSHEEVLSYLSSHDPLPVCVWGKLIKREVLIENNIYFTEGIILEDVDFCMQMYMHAKTYNYIDVTYYYYRQNRKGSVMDANTDRKFYDLFFIISIWLELSKKRYKEYAEYIHKILAFQYCMLLPMYQKLSKEQRIRQKKKTADLSCLLAKSDDKRVKMLRIINTTFGFKCTAYLLFLYDRIKLLIHRDYILRKVD